MAVTTYLIFVFLLFLFHTWHFSLIYVFFPFPRSSKFHLSILLVVTQLLPFTHFFVLYFHCYHTLCESLHSFFDLPSYPLGIAPSWKFANSSPYPMGMDHLQEVSCIVTTFYVNWFDPGCSTDLSSANYYADKDECLGHRCFLPIIFKYRENVVLRSNFRNIDFNRFTHFEVLYIRYHIFSGWSVCVYLLLA